MVPARNRADAIAIVEHHVQRNGAARKSHDGIYDTRRSNIKCLGRTESRIKGMVQKPAFLGNTSYHGRARGAAVGRRLGPSQQAIGPPWPGHFLTACLAPTNYHTGTYGTDRSHRATGSGSHP